MASANEIQHIILLYLATALLIGALATDGWNMNKKVSSLDVNSGLFRHCVNSYCSDQNGDKTVKTMELLGTAAAFICAIFMTIHYPMRKSSNSIVKSFPQVVFFIAIGGGCLVILGCVMYALDRFGSVVYPSYSYVMAIVGGIILLIGGVDSSKK